MGRWKYIRFLYYSVYKSCIRKSFGFFAFLDPTTGNSCVYDVENECNGLQCGTGFCGGDCNVVSDFVEIYVLIHVVLMKYALKIFVCDVAIECNGLECGTGFCGGDCPNSCSSFEKCDINMCVCDLANECNGLECGVGVCGNLCSHTCAPNEVCSGNSCFCDVANECNGLQCGAGFCGNLCLDTNWYLWKSLHAYYV